MCGSASDGAGLRAATHPVWRAPCRGNPQRVAYGPSALVSSSSDSLTRSSGMLSPYSVRMRAHSTRFQIAASSLLSSVWVDDVSVTIVVDSLTLSVVVGAWHPPLHYRPRRSSRQAPSQV